MTKSREKKVESIGCILTILNNRLSDLRARGEDVGLRNACRMRKTGGVTLTISRWIKLKVLLYNRIT